MKDKEYTHGADIITAYNTLQNRIYRTLKLIRDYTGLSDKIEVSNLLDRAEDTEDFMKRAVEEDAQDDVVLKDLVNNYYLMKGQIDWLMNLEVSRPQGEDTNE